MTPTACAIFIVGALRNAPLAMDCTVVDVYNTEGFESFICKIDATYVEEENLNADGKIDYKDRL